MSAFYMITILLIVALAVGYERFRECRPQRQVKRAFKGE